MAISMRAARVNAGFTQKQAAEALKIHKNTLVSYETGKTIPRADMARKMAALYGLAVSDIIFFAN